MAKQIEVPKTLRDCPPHVLAKWSYLVSGIKDLLPHLSSLGFKVQVVSIFSEESKDVIRAYKPESINKVFDHVLQMVSVPREEPRGVVEVKGQRYVFDKEFNNHNTGKIIDLKVAEKLHENPYEILSILYVEEGMDYNELNDKKQIKNPAIKREEVFKEEFPGDEFLNVCDFFLHKWSKWKDAIWALQAAKTKMTMETAKREVMSGISGQPT